MAAAWNALFTMLDGAVALDAVDVTKGAPLKKTQACVSLLGIRFPDERPAVIGINPRKEEYAIEVGVYVDRPKGDAGSVATEAVGLMSAVRSVVLANHDLSGTVGTASPAGLLEGARFAIPVQEGGWMAELHMLVNIENWIT